MTTPASPSEDTPSAPSVERWSAVLGTLASEGFSVTVGGGSGLRISAPKTMPAPAPAPMAVVPCPRSRSADAFFALLAQVKDADYIARRAGGHPTELWVGPEEARILEIEAGYKIAEGSLVNNPVVSAYNKDNVTGMVLLGLRVRPSPIPGVSVSDPGKRSRQASPISPIRPICPLPMSKSPLADRIKDRMDQRTRKPRSPIEMMIDAACGHVPGKPPEPLALTDEQTQACEDLGRDVVSNLRIFYPDVVKTRPTTWPIHLRNTIENLAKIMLRDVLENAAAKNQRHE